MVVWGFGVGFLRLEFSVDGVFGLLGWGLLVLWGWGSLNKHRKITLGKKPYVMFIIIDMEL